MNDQEILRIARRESQAAGARLSREEVVEAADPKDRTIQAALYLKTSEEGAGLNWETVREPVVKEALLPVSKGLPGFADALRLLLTSRLAWGACAAAIVALGAWIYFLDQNTRSLQARIDALERPNGSRGTGTAGSQIVAEDGTTTYATIGSKIFVASSQGDSGVAVLTGETQPKPTPELKHTPKPAGLTGFELEKPVGTSISSLQPKLSWQAPKGYKIAFYTLAVSEPDSSEEPKQLHSDTNGLMLPSGILRAGKTYVWHVIAVLVNGQEVPSEFGSFRVVDKSELDQAAAVFANPNKTHLEKAAFADKNGLLDNAEEELKQVKFIEEGLRTKALAAIEKVRKENQSR